MAVIAFQIFIVLSMAVARAVSPKALRIAAIAWSVFTLVIVFATPLILLQLFVIWGAYSLLHPKDAVPEVAVGRKASGKLDVVIGFTTPPNFAPTPAVERAEPSKYREAYKAIVAEPNKHRDALDALKAFVDADTSASNNVTAQVVDSESKCSARLERKRRVSEATQEIERSIHSEKLKIEAALQRAELKVVEEQELQRRGEEFGKLYDEANGRTGRVLAKYKRETENALELQNVPDFNVVPHHVDPAVAAAIKERYVFLEQERSERLNMMLDALAKKQVVQEAFWSLLGFRSKALLLASLDREPSGKPREHNV
jgi:hypothetical protein